jgi:DNA-binding response OmpR family regulator
MFLMVGMETGHTSRVLLMDDDDGIAAPLNAALRREGYLVERATTGEGGIARVAAGGIDLVLLDLGLPDIDGLAVCRRLRGGGYEGGILMLTARGSELDRVVGLDEGADDYVSKPFSLAELLARSRAVLRRAAAREAVLPAATARDEELATGLVIDRSARRCWVGSRELALTEKEFDLLRHLADERGGVVKREELMDRVWDVNWFGSTKTLDVTMARLRQKLESAGAASIIVTVRGVGFRLDQLTLLQASV